MHRRRKHCSSSSSSCATTVPLPPTLGLGIRIVGVGLLWWVSGLSRRGLGPRRRQTGQFFYFFYFLFLFFTKIYFRVRNLHKYTPAAPLPGGRDLAARQPGGRGLSAKKVDKKLRRGPWRTGRPAAGRPALQAARHRGGRPPPSMPRSRSCPRDLVLRGHQAGATS